MDKISVRIWCRDLSTSKNDTLLKLDELVNASSSKAGGALELDGEGHVEGLAAEFDGRGIELHLVEELIDNLLHGGDGDGPEQPDSHEARIGVAAVVA